MVRQQSHGTKIYVCFNCGAPCSDKFEVGGLTLPFCSWQHAGAWRKAERADRGRIRRAGRR
jgi:hypothetical protein